MQAQILAPLLLVEAGGGWRRAWLTFAGEVTVRRLEEVVDRALLLRETDALAWRRLHAHPEQLAEPRPEQDPAAGEPATSGPAAPGDARQTCARPTDFGAGWRLTVVAPRDVARLFRAVLCTLRRALEPELGRLPTEGEALEAMLDHALESWGASGVHAGFVRIQGRAPAALHYELGVRPGAAPLARYRSGDRVAAAPS